MIKEIHTILETFQDVYVAHTYREENGFADGLDNFHHNIDMMRIWDDISRSAPSTKRMVECEHGNCGSL